MSMRREESNLVPVRDQMTEVEVSRLRISKREDQFAAVHKDGMCTADRDG